MINQNSRIRDLVPEHYLSEFPKFVKFIELYYEWQYRQDNISNKEIEILVDSLAYSESQVNAIKEITPPGRAAKNLQRNHLLEREFIVLQTSDEFEIHDVNNVTLETPDYKGLRIQEWVQDQGSYLPQQVINKNKIDEILFVRLIKSMHLIKGTPKATELFFHLFFNEDIVQNNPYGTGAYWSPRMAITAIDNIDHKIDHKDNQMRDDYLYNEFSYVIYTKQSYSVYKDLFENVYLKYIHPAGFNAFLVQV